ncbi:MAG TPA: peptidoglycan endopeptidase [Allosphingosinicella sp.]|jgi:cell wall-associated NlpC family hydrolase
MPVKRGEAAAARARELVGSRFRPQGRRREHGLDCLGLVAAAAELPIELMPTGYAMRSEVSEDMLSLTLDGRVEKISIADAGEGDVLLVQAGPGQHHFLILLKDGFVHADARLGRVVETPGAVAWPVVAAWRIMETD